MNVFLHLVNVQTLALKEVVIRSFATHAVGSLSFSLLKPSCMNGLLAQGQCAC